MSMCFSFILLFDVIHIAQFAFSVAKAANTGLRKKEFFCFFFQGLLGELDNGIRLFSRPKVFVKKD